MVAGHAFISMDEPKYTKYKGPHNPWYLGDWRRGSEIFGKDGFQAMWGASTRGHAARAERYRKNLIKNKIPFTAFIHPAGKIPGFSEQSAVVEFIFFKEVMVANWFKTRKEANKELKKRQKEKTWYCSDEVWEWSHTKRKKPFFVGFYFEWINK